MVRNTRYFAHSLEGRPVSEWQPLEEHRTNDANMMAEFSKHL